MAATTKWLPIEDIRPDGGTQTRSELRPDIIQEYAEAMTAGAKFPPVDVFWDGNGHYWLADGFHRFQAAMQSEQEKLECRIHKGELRDAIWFALSANATNGLRRTNPDKRRAVTIALSDKEWQSKSDQLLADHIGVGRSLVYDIRNELVLKTSSEPVRRTGKDGKQRPTRNKKRSTRTVAEDDTPPPSRASTEEIDTAERITSRIQQKRKAINTLNDLEVMLDVLELSEELAEHTEAIREKLTE